jgi:hypothetical protein
MLRRTLSGGEYQGTSLFDISSTNRPLLLACMAFVSGLLSDFAAFPSKVTAGGVPLLPGIYFALVIAFATFFWARRDIFRAVIVFFLTVFAWFLAVRVALHIYDTIDHTIRIQYPPPEPSAPNPSDLFPSNIRWPVHAPYLLGMCGIVAGFVASLVIAFAVSLAASQFRLAEHWMRTLLIGSVLGSLLELDSYPKFIPELVSDQIFSGNVLLLYVSWQVSVAASIAYGLVSKGKDTAGK